MTDPAVPDAGLRDTALTDTDGAWLRRCVDLAEEALEAGDEPFGSLLIDADGAELIADLLREYEDGAAAHNVVDWQSMNVDHIERAIELQQAASIPWITLRELPAGTSRATS